MINSFDTLCSDVISLLQGGNVLDVGQSSRQRTELARSYQTDTKKFLEDVVVSLDNYTTTHVENVDKMIEDLHGFNTDLAAKLADMKIQAKEMVEHRTRLAALLFDFKTHI